MRPANQISSIDDWVADVRNFINTHNPSLNAIAEVHISEAKFGRHFIDENLRDLPNGSEILELGAGSLLLSSQLVREGYKVTALEPIGVGFSHFNELQKLILELSSIRNCKPALLNLHVENLNVKSMFAFAFSINVMEHVDDVELAIARILDALCIKSSYRFTCPNYAFPYEQHFNIPIIVNKKFTQMLLKHKIYLNKNISDPIGVWESLNWISVERLKDIAQENTSLELKFNKKMLGNTFQRLNSDAEFSSRRSGLVLEVGKLIVALKLHKLMQFIPISIQPIIDCTILKNA